MTTKVIGLIQLNDQDAFEQYRSQVGQTVEHYEGKISARGVVNQLFWNELACYAFEAFVELEFPDLDHAKAWAGSAEYQALLAVRSKAMKLTLFSAST
ncbi:DUF1330 domain-containing protein [Polynucleobacter sp. AP-Nino-20-G2]|uniref:DUF1330 domain-containing protein n=1 Tax=Polynucleobacter sp. AP-Nino-20-G2 TaxID=2576917 RepID=UPI001BFD4138|nr:DUF1330 domain-containing protein [Polynucleobacter sp. AP-Nino-20-G2]QWE15889.1 DUF1330 domain-containing protein [Polynucleobacter sp. AP-Nino-20-G2]